MRWFFETFMPLLLKIIVDRTINKILLQMIVEIQHIFSETVFSGDFWMCRIANCKRVIFSIISQWFIPNDITFYLLLILNREAMSLFIHQTPVFTIRKSCCVLHTFVQQSFPDWNLYCIIRTINYEIILIFSSLKGSKSSRRAYKCSIWRNHV